MKTTKYILFWLTGKKEYVTGTSIVGAIRDAGYSQGAVRALDFYAEAKNEHEYAWDASLEKWYNIEIRKMAYPSLSND